VIFLGTPDFAVPTLQALLAANENVVAVVTQPDRPRGRGQVVTPSPVKALALAHGLPVLQPVRLKDPHFMGALKEFAPELMVVTAYGRILTHEMLALPSVGFLNVHASLLPRHRGSAPINWALIRGDRETGVTIMWVTFEVDTGPIFLQERVPITAEDNAGSLGAKLAQVGAAQLVKSLDLLLRGQGIRRTQPEEGVTLAPRITAEMRRLNWQQSAPEVAGWIRGLDPKPGAYTHLQGVRLRLFGARVLKAEGSSAPAGTNLRLGPHGFEIACGRGSLAVEGLQLPGKKRLTAAEFLRGHPCIHQVLA
jgi:methionyl-tRNA formyltransferase